jgi:hypothetical protein
MSGEVLLEIAFAGPVIHWRGPAPFFFVGIPGHHTDDVRDAARRASYGWGCVPVEAEANGVAFTTSLFPKDGGYLLPLKAAVRKQAAISLGDRIAVGMIVRDR